MTRPGPVVGSDVATAELVVAVRPGDARWRVPNDARGLARLRQLASALVVLEATGGYERAAVAAVAVTQLPVVVVNPRQVRDVARATIASRFSLPICARPLQYQAPVPKKGSQPSLDGPSLPGGLGHAGRARTGEGFCDHRLPAGVRG